MGRYCRLCGRRRAHEKFGGKGQRRFICRDCLKLPKTEREQRLAEEELTGFMFQENISRKNIGRLKTLSTSKLPGIAELASLILSVARTCPRKRGRRKYLLEHDPALLDVLVGRGFERIWLPDPWEAEWEDGWDPSLAEAEFHHYFSCGLDGDELDRRRGVPVEPEFHQYFSCGLENGVLGGSWP